MNECALSNDYLSLDDLINHYCLLSMNSNYSILETNFSNSNSTVIRTRGNSCKTLLFPCDIVSLKILIIEFHLLQQEKNFLVMKSV